MAKYGDIKEFTFADKKGKETKFRFNHIGLQGAYELRERAENESTGKLSLPKLHKELFEHVVRAVDENGDTQKVNYLFFEEKEEGTTMLSEVVAESTNFLFR